MEIIIANRWTVDARAKCACCGNLITASTGDTLYSDDIPKDIMDEIGTVVCKFCQPLPPTKTCLELAYA